MDEPQSKRCVSAQRFCLAAIASKSTGSAAAEVVTVLPDSEGGGGGGTARTKKRHKLFKNMHIELRNESQIALLAE